MMTCIIILSDMSRYYDIVVIEIFKIILPSGYMLIGTQPEYLKICDKKDIVKF